MICIDMGNNEHAYIFGAWLPFDDGIRERLTTFTLSLTLVETYIQSVIRPYDYIMLLGDLNCDPVRKSFWAYFFKFFTRKCTF